MFSFHHISLSVSNIENSVKFYSAFGFVSVLHWESEDRKLKIEHLKLGIAFLELFCFSNPEPAPDSMNSLEKDLQVIGTRHFGLKVKSILQAKEYLISNNMADNIEIIHGKTGIDYFFIKDPDGIFVEVVQDDRNL